MSRVFFAGELEGVATFWRIERRDGVALGFTGHDRDLWFDGLLHHAAPGMLPSAIRRTAALDQDSAEVRGALTHDGLRDDELAEGRFDGAFVAIGVVDWETLERAILYHGEIGALSEEDGGFEAELLSAKAALQADTVPRTSPTCRARFCGPGCGLSSAHYTHELACSSIDHDARRVTFAGGPGADSLRGGWIRWIDGPHGGITMQVMAADSGGLVLDQPLDIGLAPGARAQLREGCDHTIATCAARFGNAANFRGEPFLPGNDLLARYPTSTS